MWSQSHGGKLFHLKFTFNLFRHYNINLTWFEASLRFGKKEFMAKSKTDVMLTIHKHTAGHVKDNRKCYNEEGDDMRPEAKFTSQSPQIKFPEFPVAFNIQLSQPLKCVHNQVTSQHWASHLGNLVSQMCFWLGQRLSERKWEGPPVPASWTRSAHELIFLTSPHMLPLSLHTDDGRMQYNEFFFAGFIDTCY